MKIYLSKYRNHWLSPYTILEKVFFWREIDYDEPIIDKLSKILNPFSVVLMKFLDFIHPPINYVKIDRWDTWSMDHTLAQIILPMLKQLKETNHGYHLVDLEDVPEELRSISHEEWDSQFCFDWYHDKQFEDLGSARWDWVMNEMIWTFEQLADDDNDAQFHSGVHDIIWKPVDGTELRQMEKGPNDTAKFDVEGYNKHQERIKKGLFLFGKYYRGLWD